LGKNAEADNWFGVYESPLKNEMLRARDVILDADARIEEWIKWKSPTLTFKGNLASFNPRAKAHVSLMFHTGAHIPGDHPPCLEGGGDTARYMRFASFEDLDAKKGELEAVVRAWCAWKASLALP
jgi:hypothetical protein